MYLVFFLTTILWIVHVPALHANNSTELTSNTTLEEDFTRKINTDSPLANYSIKDTFATQLPSYNYTYEEYISFNNTNDVISTTNVLPTEYNYLPTSSNFTDPTTATEKLQSITTLENEKSETRESTTNAVLDRTLYLKSETRESTTNAVLDRTLYLKSETRESTTDAVLDRTLYLKSETRGSTTDAVLDRTLYLKSETRDSTTDAVLDRTLYLKSFAEESTFSNDILEQVLTTESEFQTSEYSFHIVVGKKCNRIFQDSVLWNDTDGGVLAKKSCPQNYDGKMFRPCFSSGKWGSVDYTGCRLKRLGAMRHVFMLEAEKGMLENMYGFVEEFSQYLSSVDMKSPLDRLEAFEILNMFLKQPMNLKMDKPKDTKYTATLIHICNELIQKKTVMFTPGSQKNKLITEKAVEMISHLSGFAEMALYGLLKTHKKHIAFRSSPNVLVYLYRGRLSGQFALMNMTSEKERDDDMSSYFSVEETLKRSAYALIWMKGLESVLSTPALQMNSDVALATLLSPLNSLNHLPHPPTFDISLKMNKPVPDGYTVQCGHFWNISSLWNLQDCVKLSVKGLVVTCRCHHLGSTAVLLQENHDNNSEHLNPIGKMVSVSCVISIFATVLTLIVNFLLKRDHLNLSVFIVINLAVCTISIQFLFLYGVGRTDRIEFCLLFAVLLHYMFVVLCCWVLAYGVNLLWLLRSNMKYSGRPRDYCIVCWLLPGLLLVVSFLINRNRYETNLYCWMNLQRGILSFAILVTGFIMTNTGVIILALRTFNEQMSVTHRIDICKIRNSLRAGITLQPFFAVNWFFGILAIEKSDDTVLQAVFALTNSAQGILTFVFFCIMDSNIQNAFRLKMSEVCRKPKICSMKLKRSNSFPILERSLITLHEDRRRMDCTPLLAGRSSYHDVHEDPCCSNIRV